MMSYSPTSILDRTVSREILHKLCFLWQEIALLAGDNALLFTDTDLNQKNSFVEGSANRDRQWDSFRLLILPQFQALLAVKADSNESHCQISIAFDANTIARLLSLPIELFKAELVGLTGDRESNHDRVDLSLQLQNQFLLQLLSVLQAESDTLSVSIHSSFSNYQSFPETLHDRLEQQHILDRVKIQVNQNLDLVEIVKMTIEQVRHFLKVDRLVIYQLEVPFQSSENNFPSPKLIDTVTHEAKLSEETPSILYFQDEICFTRSPQCQEKYRQGISLVVDDVEANSNLTECLILLMRKLQVKAKLVTPIIVHNKLWGFVIAHQCFAPRKWKGDEINFLKQVAEHLSIAIYQNEAYLQLQQQKNILEEQVKKRAQQLQDALLAAQVASHSKNEFLGNMSHELRTPLTCVIGLSGTLLHWSLAEGNTALPLEKQRQYLKTIQDSGKHLLDLINNILDFSEMESGKTLLNLKRFSLYNLAKNVLQVVREEADKKQILLELDFKIDAEQEHFCADRDRIKQILLNLLSNGIKFTPEEGRVILKIWREQQQVVFEIEDTGIGIAKQNLPLLFEKFQQLESSRQRTHGGTGLGLALTKQLVELHGGTIEVESVVGKGSIFTVYLQNQTDSKLKDDNNLESRDRFSQTKTIILIAQDEETSTLICELLMAANYQVVWLIDDYTAIQQIELLEPSIVIIDREFSEINVEQISKTLKQLHTTKNIKIMLLCSQMTPSKWKNLSAQGVDDYLLKPVQPTALLAKISSLIK
jgi:two-component system, sensor histidine kinase and response regulator